MKNETAKNFESPKTLTRQALQHLKDKGFQFVQVRGFTLDRRQDYLEPRILVLFPIKDLPEDPNKKDIYEPIDSKILADWADTPDDGMKIFVASV